MMLLPKIKVSLAVYGATAWACVIVIMYHVANDLHATTLAKSAMAWLVFALPVFISMDCMAVAIRRLRAALQEKGE